MINAILAPFPKTGAGGRFPIQWFSIVNPMVFDRTGTSFGVENHWIDDRKLRDRQSKTIGLEIEGQ